MNVLLFARYGALGASSRVRSYQYLPYLESQGIHVTPSRLLSDDYLRMRYAGCKPSWARLVVAYTRRLAAMLHARQYDLIWIEKEMFPWLPPWAEQILRASGIPYVVEYDDAVFHQYDRHPSAWVRALLGTKVDRIMRGAVSVIAGNDYLAERAQHAHARRVEIIPSAVDCEAYFVRPQRQNDPPVIGWIGTPVTSMYLNLIDEALGEVCKGGRAHLVLVGADPNTLKHVEAEVRSWDAETEVLDVQNFDVGIMPLPDRSWEKGKCGYKLIQYMACGVPVVASPVGANRSIVTDGQNGFTATTCDEWIDALSALLDAPNVRERMGIAGRRRVEEEFCTRLTGPRLAKVLRTSALG